MKLAKTLAEDNTTCYSRSVGAVLVSDSNYIISLGYNGPATNVPHADTKEYLEYLHGIIAEEDWDKIKELNIRDKDKFVSSLENCKICPRRLLKIPSGEKLHYCPCSHAERNCIFSASVNGSSTKNSTLYCYCQCPCHECAVAIIQAKIKKVVCCDFGNPLYSPSSPGLFKMASVLLEVVDPESFETKEPDKWWK